VSVASEFRRLSRPDRREEVVPGLRTDRGGCPFGPEPTSARVIEGAPGASSPAAVLFLFHESLRSSGSFLLPAVVCRCARLDRPNIEHRGSTISIKYDAELLLGRGDAARRPADNLAMSQKGAFCENSPCVGPRSSRAPTAEPALWATHGPMRANVPVPSGTPKRMRLPPYIGRDWRGVPGLGERHHPEGGRAVDGCPTPLQVPCKKPHPGGPDGASLWETPESRCPRRYGRPGGMGIPAASSSSLSARMPAARPPATSTPPMM